MLRAPTLANALAVLLVILALTALPGPALSGFSTPGFDAPVNALAVYEGDVIAGGEFSRSGQTPLGRIARWDGARWLPLGEGLAGDQIGWIDMWGNVDMMGPHVYALALYGSDLIAGGAFVTAGGDTAHNVARWDGSAWHAMGSGLTGMRGIYFGTRPYGAYYARVGVLAVVQDTLWAAGFACRLSYWNGSNWVPSSRRTWGSDSGYTGIDYVAALAPFGDQFVIGGHFYAAGALMQQANSIAAWGATGVNSLEGGMLYDGNPAQARVSSLIPWDGMLVATGLFTSAGAVAAGNVALWDGTAWHAMGTMPVRDTPLALFRGELFAGGYRWNGTTWENVFQTDATIRAAAVFRDRLVVGGDFTQMGGTPAGRIGAWPDEMTPVTLQAFTATRIGPAAELSWRLADGGEAVLNVWRREGGAARVRLTVEPLTAATGAYRDEAPPAAGAEYWLEELVFEGENVWFGPTILEPVPAAAVTLDVAPNPFNPGATVSFTLGQAEVVRLTVHDLRGALVATLADDPWGVGPHSLSWDGTDGQGRALAAGTYLLRLVAGRERVVRKVSLIR